jgi:hypothetical protein
VQRGRVGPLQVLQDEDEPGRFGRGPQRRHGRLDGEEPRGRVGRRLGGEFQQGGAEVADAVAARLVEQPVPQPERRGALVRSGPPDQYRAAAGGRFPRDRLDERGLADARLAGDDRDGAVSSVSAAGSEEGAECFEFVVAADRGHGCDRPPGRRAGRVVPWCADQARAYGLVSGSP